ncbi:Protein phosphatase methylesterase 1 [Teratosphaeriaceae sp. CCFEE 6253]|nr:Protein phosphatase methylesterase 1 [Teratosphaeriaceae sp. CCFEE 6253]
MSGLLRQSVKGAPSPPPHPTSISEADEQEHSSSSDSSASPAESTASVNTVRPSSREQVASPSHSTKYFDRELYLDHGSEAHQARYHVYLTPPADVKKGPLFICHHGAGASGLSFAVFAQHVRQKVPDAGILSLEARGHGSTVTDSITGHEIPDFSLPTLAADALTMIILTKEAMDWPQLPPCVLVGHSLGGAVVTQLAVDYALGSTLIGYSVIDVVEGSAIDALQHMRTYLSSRPSVFPTLDEAIQWHIRSRTIRDPESAHASVPSLFTQTPSGKFVWKTDYAATMPYWEEWFTGMSKKFLAGRGAKELILAGTDRLDRELMIGQMQGKFQLVVVPEAGHFVQEDVPEKTAGLLVEFFRRNDRSAMVLPPKVSELLAMGKKV